MLRIMLPALLLLAGFPTAATAQEVRPARSVSYGDLALHSPAGVAELDRRIERAITASCAEDSARDLQRQTEVRRCQASKRREIAAQREQALASARRLATEVASAR